MTFWCGSGSGSGSADPCLWLNGSGSCYFRHWPSRCQFKFFAYYFLKVHLHNFQRKKVKKKSQSSRNQGFSYFFYLVIEVWIWIRIQVAQNHVDPDPASDPDPQHWWWTWTVLHYTVGSAPAARRDVHSRGNAPQAGLVLATCLSPQVGEQRKFRLLLNSVVEPKIFLSTPGPAPRSRKSELWLRLQLLQP